MSRGGVHVLFSSVNYSSHPQSQKSDRHPVDNPQNLLDNPKTPLYPVKASPVQRPRHPAYGAVPARNPDGPQLTGLAAYSERGAHNGYSNTA